jgi:hypothetical protein
MTTHNYVRSQGYELEDLLQHERIYHIYETRLRARCSGDTQGSTINLELEHRW